MPPKRFHQAIPPSIRAHREEEGHPGRRLLSRAAGLMLLVFLSSSLFPRSAPAAGLAAENTRYRVEQQGGGEYRFEPEAGGRVRFHFSVTDKAAKSRSLLVLDNATARIGAIRLLGGRLIVLGEEAHLHSTIATVFDLEARREIDAVMGLDARLSEGGRYLVYRKFFPPDSSEPERRSDLVLVYDLEADPDANRLNGREDYRNDPVGEMTEAGRPVYPESYLRKRSYRVWVPDEKDRHAVLPGGFFWLDRDRRIVFADHYGPDYYLVVLDLSAGLEGPSVEKRKLEIRFQPGEGSSASKESSEGSPAVRLESVAEADGGLRIRLSSHPPLIENEFRVDIGERDEGAIPVEPQSAVRAIDEMN